MQPAGPGTSRAGRRRRGRKGSLAEASFKMVGRPRVSKDEQVISARCFAVDIPRSGGVDRNSMEAVYKVLRTQIWSSDVSLVRRIGWHARGEEVPSLAVGLHHERRKTKNTLAEWMQAHAQAPLAWTWRVVAKEHISWDVAPGNGSEQRQLGNALFSVIQLPPTVLLPPRPAPPAVPPLLPTAATAIAPSFAGSGGGGGGKRGRDGGDGGDDRRRLHRRRPGKPKTVVDRISAVGALPAVPDAMDLEGRLRKALDLGGSLGEELGLATPPRSPSIQMPVEDVLAMLDEHSITSVGPGTAGALELPLDPPQSYVAYFCTTHLTPGCV